MTDENEELTWSRDSLKVKFNSQKQAREKLEAEIAKERENNSDKKDSELEAQIKILADSQTEVKLELLKVRTENEKLKSDLSRSKEVISAKEKQKEAACQTAKRLDDELKVRIKSQSELESKLAFANRKTERLVSETKALKNERETLVRTKTLFKTDLK